MMQMVKPGLKYILREVEKFRSETSQHKVPYFEKRLQLEFSRNQTFKHFNQDELWLKV
jgi:hypothetical protein